MLSKLAGTVWLDEYGALWKHSWVVEGEVLERAYAEAQGGWAIPFRRSLDGREVEAVYSTITKKVTFPSPDSWLEGTPGADTFGCRLAANAAMLMCEVNEKGQRISFSLRRATEQDFAAMVVQGTKFQQERAAWEANDRAFQRSQWGAFALAALDYSSGKPLLPRKSYRIAIIQDGRLVHRLTTTYRWVNTDGNLEMKEFITEYGNTITYNWTRNPKTGTIRRMRDDGAEDTRFAVTPDGTVTGKYVYWYDHEYKSRQISVVSTSSGMEFVDATAGRAKWRAEFEEVPFAEHEKEIYAASARREAEDRAKKAQGGGGGGIGGMLAGALLGGALTGGSAEGILAGARALAPSDEARAQLDQQSADLAADRQRQAREDAAFQARIAATVRQSEQQQQQRSPAGNQPSVSQPPSSANGGVTATSGPAAKPGPAAAANATTPAADPVRYFSCLGQRVERSDKGDRIAEISYGVVTSRHSPYDVLQRFKQQTRSSRGADAENPRGSCFPNTTLAEAEAMVAASISRDRPMKVIQTTGVDFSF